MRIFEMHRDVDVSGISGTGIVARGVEFSPEGPVVIRWLGETPSTVIWKDIMDARQIHSHGGATRFVWLADWMQPANEPTDEGNAVDEIDVAEPDEDGQVELYHNEWVSLRAIRKPEYGIDNYVYSHETRCSGRIVAILPFRATVDGLEFLVRSDVTPCWGPEPVLSSITRGYEGGDIEDDAVHEVLEEAGYTISRGDLIPLGRSYASKSADTVYSLFAVDLTGAIQGEASGDGTLLEASGTSVWLPEGSLYVIRDPQVAVMYLRLKR